MRSGLSLRARMLLVVVAMVALGFAVTILIMVRQASSMQTEAAYEYVEALATSAARDSGRNTVIEPYWYEAGDKNVLMTSLVSPVMQNGKAQGVVGVDMTLDMFQNRISQIRPYETGYARLVSSGRVYIGHPDGSLVGRTVLPQSPLDQALEKRTLPQQLVVDDDPILGEETFNVIVPVSVGNVNDVWSLAITVPMSRVLAQVNTLRDVSAAATQIAQGNTDLSQRTEEQAAALQETAASIEELSVTVRQNADHADRASEEGRGFAVVAGEVRTLAQRSASAAHEIKALIETSVSLADQSTQRVDQASQIIRRAATAIGEVASIMNEIASASAQQSDGLGQINVAVSQMDSVTQQNAALVQQAAAAAASLQDQARQLAEAVSIFKV